MKLLIFLLIVTLSTSFSPIPRWLQDVSVTVSVSVPEEEEFLLEEEASVMNYLPEIQADPLLNEIFDFGFNYVIDTGISRGRVPNTTFHPVSVSDWSRTPQTNGVTDLYSFTAEGVSDDGNSVIETTFTVHYDVPTQVIRPGTYVSKTTTTTVTTPGEPGTTVPETPQPPVVVVVVPPAATEEEAVIEVSNEESTVRVNLLPEIQADPVLNDIFTFGINGVIASGISRGRIPNTTFTPVFVSDWDKKPEGNGELYSFSAIAVSQDGGSVVNTDFNVFYDPATQQKTLRGYSTKTTTTTNTMTPEEIAAAEEAVLVVEEEMTL